MRVFFIITMFKLRYVSVCLLKIRFLGTPDENILSMFICNKQLSKAEKFTKRELEDDFISPWPPHPPGRKSSLRSKTKIDICKIKIEIPNNWRFQNKLETILGT